MLIPQPDSSAHKQVAELSRLRQVPFDPKHEKNFQFKESQLKNELSSVVLVMKGNSYNLSGQCLPRKNLLSMIDDNPKTCFLIDESNLYLMELHTPTA